MFSERRQLKKYRQRLQERFAGPQTFRVHAERRGRGVRVQEQRERELRERPVQQVRPQARGRAEAHEEAHRVRGRLQARVGGRRRHV